jgi:hypothetical protein
MSSLGCDAQCSKPQLHGGLANADSGAPLEFSFVLGRDQPGQLGPAGSPCNV